MTKEGPPHNGCVCVFSVRVRAPLARSSSARCCFTWKRSGAAHLLSLSFSFSLSFSLPLPLSLSLSRAAPGSPAAAHVGSAGVSLCSSTDSYCHFSPQAGHAGVKEVAVFFLPFPLYLSSLLCGLKHTKCRPERHYRPLTSATRRM